MWHNITRPTGSLVILWSNIIKPLNTVLCQNTGDLGLQRSRPGWSRTAVGYLARLSRPVCGDLALRPPTGLTTLPLYSGVRWSRPLTILARVISARPRWSRPVISARTRWSRPVISARVLSLFSYFSINSIQITSGHLFYYVI